jgi:hypothetical protein
MAWTKAKTAIVIGASILVAAGTATVVIEKSRATHFSGLADRNYKSALDVLSAQVNKTRRELPPGLTNEFEQSLAARLKTIQESVSQKIVTEDKSALMSKRILELSEHVMTMPYRKIPEYAQQRKEAQQQYAAVLDRFEKVAPDRIKHLDELSRTVIGGALRQVLTDVQQDIFRPGYGRPLSEQEKVELNLIVDGMLQAAAGLPDASEKKGTQAFELREAAKVANNGRQAVLEFLRNRDAGLAKNSSFVTAFMTWRSEISTIEKAVDRDLEIAERAEINAVIERARQQEEKDIRENDPKKKAAEAQATAKEK